MTITILILLDTQKLKKSEMLYIHYRNANVQQSGTVSRAPTHNVIFSFNQVVL